MRSLGLFFELLFLSVLTAFPALAQGPVDSLPQTSAIQFEVQKIDLGDIPYDKDSTYVYRFVYENKGSAPLIVNQVVGHCPCVTVDFSSEPLQPGGRDMVTVYFKPAHASKYSQRITVFNNSSRSVVTLFAKGNFLKPSDPKLTAKPNQDE